MHPRHISRRSAAIAAAALLVLGVFAGTAAALLTASSGGTQVQMDNRADTDLQSTVQLPWTPLAGSDILLTVQDTRLINARFTAESRCNGQPGGRCTVRIVAVNIVTGAVVELNPASGLDFSFDAVTPGAYDDTEEGHAMERSIRLQPGKYRLRVEFGVSIPNVVKSTLDDWHFAVETST
jgi:hypothetical protein